MAGPTSFTESMFLQKAHTGHPGVVKNMKQMKRRLREAYWWPMLDTQVLA